MHRNFRNTVSGLFIATLTVVGMGTGCNKQPSDPQLAQQVQSQISGDSALQGQPITVAVSNGVVTLSGSVADPSARELAGNDAARVTGVKTVMNNLSAGGAAMTQQTGEANESGTGRRSYSTEPSGSPVAQGYVIPAGTSVRIQLSQTLSSESSRTGENWSGTVADPIVVNGRTIVRAGSQASGSIVDAKDIGHFAGGAVLSVRLDTVTEGGHPYPIQSSQVDRFEKGKGERTAIITGGGAGLGALIGGLTGGGKGALIGGLLGAGAGGAGSAFTGNKDIILPAESVLTFQVLHDVRMR